VTHEQQAWDPSKRHIANFEKRGEYSVHPADRVRHTGKWLKE
jgi:hypothetical protein